MCAGSWRRQKRRANASASELLQAGGPVFEVMHAHDLAVLDLMDVVGVDLDDGQVHDRDVNAAVNLRNLAVSSTVSVCGEAGSGSGRKTRVKPASVKRQVSFVPIQAGMNKSD